MSTGTMTDSELVTRSVADGVAVLTWNRPERNNGWTVAMETEYFRLLEECGHDPAVRVIVVTGAGRSFCPGMDAEVLADQARKGATTDRHLRTPFTLPRSIPKPIIAAINGACAGIGLVAAINCDLRFASSTDKLTTSFAQRGIMAEHGLGADVIPTKTLAEWVSLAAEHGSALSPAHQSVEDVAQDPTSGHATYSSRVSTPWQVPSPMLGRWPSWTAAIRVRWHAPSPGEHTAEALAELGMSEDAIGRLTSQSAANDMNNPC